MKKESKEFDLRIRYYPEGNGACSITIMEGMKLRGEGTLINLADLDKTIKLLSRGDLQKIIKLIPENEDIDSIIAEWIESGGRVEIIKPKFEKKKRGNCNISLEDLSLDLNMELDLEKLELLAII